MTIWLRKPWKTKRALRQPVGLNNKSEPQSRDYKRIIESIIKGFDTPVYDKLIRGIKKYQGRPDDTALK